MRVLAMVAVCAAFSGCFGGSLGLQDMTAEQITAMSKIKDAAISCIHGLYAGATVNVVFVSVDKGIPSGITVDTDCKVTFTSPAQAK